MRLLLDLPRTLLTVTAGVVTTVVCVVIVVAVAVFDDTAPAIERVIRFWARVWMVTSGTSLQVEGRENVDPARSYVVVANHLSTLDIMACLLALPVPIRFLAKKELFRIPILAQGMRVVGVIEVDRDARSAVHAEVNRQAKQLVAKGRSLIIYAEGTRPRDGVMRQFKKGAFTMAIASGLPVLPVAIHGSYQAWRPGTPLVRGGRVKVVIDPPIETDRLTQSDNTELRDRVRAIIASHVEAMGGPVGDA